MTIVLIKQISQGYLKMAKTKADLEKEIKKLKQEVRDLRGEVKETEVTLEGLTSEGFGVVFLDKNYYLVNLKYNIETNRAAIIETEKISDNLTAAVNVSQRALGKYVVELKRS